jgi:hypothetical protein
MYKLCVGRVELKDGIRGSAKKRGLSDSQFLYISVLFLLSWEVINLRIGHAPRQVGQVGMGGVSLGRACLLGIRHSQTCQDIVVVLWSSLERLLVNASCMKAATNKMGVDLALPRELWWSARVR